MSKAVKVATCFCDRCKIYTKHMMYYTRKFSGICLDCGNKKRGCNAEFKEACPIIDGNCELCEHYR